MNKTNTFYYSTLDDNGDHIYTCLTNDVITQRSTLDFKHSKHYQMNASYEATEEDLVRFKDDLIRMNNEILQKPYFSTVSKVWFKINVFNYNCMNQYILNIMLINTQQ